MGCILSILGIGLMITSLFFNDAVIAIPLFMVGAAILGALVIKDAL